MTMAKFFGDVLQEPGKPCRVCGETIVASARKCIHCDSWQDWRAELGVSSQVLALLVALVSVTAPLITAVDSVMNPPVAEFSIKPVQVLVHLLRLEVTNFGVKPGAIGNVVVRGFGSDERETVSSQFASRIATGPQMILPSETKTIYLDRVNESAAPHKFKLRRCELDVDTFRTRDATAKVAIDCEYAETVFGKSYPFAKYMPVPGRDEK